MNSLYWLYHLYWIDLLTSLKFIFFAHGFDSAPYISLHEFRKFSGRLFFPGFYTYREAHNNEGRTQQGFLRSRGTTVWYCRCTRTVCMCVYMCVSPLAGDAIDDAVMLVLLLILLVVFVVVLKATNERRDTESRKMKGNCAV